MTSETTDAIKALVTDRGISEELVMQTIEEFLLAAYKRTYGTIDNAVVKFEDENVSIYARKEIVEEIYNPVEEIELSKAKELNAEGEIGDELLIKIDPKDFDRGAVQSAKQRARENLRDIQKDTLYSEFKSKEGEVIIGYYQRERNGTIFVDLGKTEGILPRRYQCPRESYRVNDRIKALIYEVNKSPTGLQIVLTRTHTEFVHKIFELEVPEIYDKTVEIFKIVREPGYRTKVAVYSNRLDVDPTGACVGLRGMRIQSIVRELEGERIDILKFSSDPRELIQNALNPATVKQVIILDEIKKQALAIVDDDQLSLAIGKQGLNVRLANRLVDWSIDVKSEAQFEEMDIAIASKQAISNLFNDDDNEITLVSELPNISPRLVTILNQDNIEYIEDLLSIDENEMTELEGITQEDVDFLLSIIKENLIVENGKENALENQVSEEDDVVEDVDSRELSDDGKKKTELAIADDDKEQYYEEGEITHVSELPGIPESIVDILTEAGVLEIVTLLDMEDDELQKIPKLGDENIRIIKGIIKNAIEVIEEEE